MSKKVSIIIPVYNKEDYIERCVCSVMNQTFRHLEVILIDDCSPDDSMAVARRAIAESENSEDLEFVYLRHEENLGLSEARNTGIRAASGDYLFFLDSDDALTPSCISLMMEQVRMHPLVELVQGYTVSVPDDIYFHTEELNYMGYRESNLLYVYEMNRMRNFPITAWNKLLNRDFVVRNNLFFQEGIIHEDQHWMFYVARCVSRFVFIPETTYLRYYIPNSIMTNLNPKESCASIAKILYDVVPKIDYPCQYSKLNRMIRLFFGSYISKGGDGERRGLEKLFITRMLKEGMVFGAFLLFCRLHFSGIKGGWRFRRWLNLYLDRQSKRDRRNLYLDFAARKKSDKDINDNKTFGRLKFKD